MAGSDSTAGTRVDMHVKILDEAVVERAKARGLDALVYAPHFTRLPEIRERARRFSDEDLLVVPARELFTGDWRRRKHVLAVGLEDPVPDFLTLEGTMAELRRQDAAVLVPHPEFLSVSLDREAIREYTDAIDAVEIYNPKHWSWQNRRATEIAREVDKPVFTSSYAHLRRTVGEAWTTFHDPVESETDVVDAVKRGASRTIQRREGLQHRLRCKLEFAHLGWENTWKKFDRVYLQGTEPTHPGHIAYGGAFDDVRLY